VDQRNRITAQTKLLGIFGHPVGHSLSPIFQNAGFSALNLDFVYLAFDVPSEELTQAVQSIHTLKLHGINVTVPHKEAIVPLLNRLENPVPVLGAVNVVIPEGKELVGYNTDASGFSKALDQNHVEVRGKSAVLLGAGGAARAVLFVLCQKGIKKVKVYNRSPSRSFHFQRWAKDSLSFEIGTDTWENFIGGKSSFIESTEILINTTSLGLHQEVISIPWDKLENCGSVIDVVYHRDETPLVKEARRRHKLTFDGKPMLLYQGAESFRLFTGCEAPLRVMEKALNETAR